MKNAPEIGVIGLWHLGCVLCASWSKLGCHVQGFDFDEQIVQNLQKAIAPIYEPHLNESLSDSMRKGLLAFSQDIQSLDQCDFIFVAYDTPVNPDDSSDTRIIEKSISAIKKVAKKGTVIIISSQSPIGFCRKLMSELKQQNDTLDLAYSPENLRLGEAIDCYLNPGRIILGTANAMTQEKCHALFGKLSAQILDMSLESAELVKHGINCFLATSIVFANQLADICETHGARIDDVVTGLKSDDRIGKKAYLAPGIGFSGGTLGRDLKVLFDMQENAENSSNIFQTIYTANQSRKHSIVRKINQIAGDLTGLKIGVLGLTYKPGTSTLRRSLPLEIVQLLKEKKCEISVYDPKADYSELDNPDSLNIARSIEDVARNTDMLLLLTDWPEFKVYPWNRALDVMKSNKFFDAKNALEEKQLTDYGFQYFSLGRS